jgi:hypothetical protein
MTCARRSSGTDSTKRSKEIFLLRPVRSTPVLTVVVAFKPRASLVGQCLVAKLEKLPAFGVEAVVLPDNFLHRVEAVLLPDLLA